MTLQIFWPKPGNPREGGQKGGTNGREGGGREGGSRAKPGIQLVSYIYANRHFHKMPLKTNRIKFKVAVCGQYLGYDRSNEGPLVVLPCYVVCIKIDASLICICKTIYL